MKFKNKNQMVANLPQCRQTLTHTSHSHISSDSTIRFHCAQTPHTHTHSCLHCCAQVGKQERVMLEWMSRMSQPKERRHHTATLVGWATFICCLVPGQDGLHCSPETRGSEWGLTGRTWGFSGCESPRTELLSHHLSSHYSSQHWSPSPRRSESARLGCVISTSTLQRRALFHMLMSPEITHAL